MEQQQEEILMRRSFQKKTVALVLSVLARGLKVCRSVDEPVREMFDGFPEDFIFVLGVYGSRHPVVLQNRRTGLYRAHETVAAASQKIPLPPATALAKHFSAGEYDRRQMLEIRFKSVEAAFRMVTGQLSAEQAYARHDLIIRGEIGQAMRFLRAIQRVKGYLFPRTMARRLLPEDQELPCRRWRVWVRMLHLKKRRAQSAEEEG